MDTPSFYFCICPDSGLARRQVHELAAAWQKRAELPKTTVFWGDDDLSDAFWAKLTQAGLIKQEKILLVRQAQLLPTETWKKVSATLAKPFDSVLPVFFLEVEWEKKQPKLPAHIAKLRCLDFAKQQNWVWQNPGLDNKGLYNYLTQKAKLLKLQLQPEVLNTLSNITAPDSASADRVLEQLSLASVNGTVDMVDTLNLGVNNPELIIFDFIRCLESGNSVTVWKSLQRDDDDTLFFPFLSLMNREAKQLWLLLHGGRAAFPPFIINSKAELAQKLGREGLANILKMIGETDWAVKTGQRQVKQAWDELVASMTLIFRG